MMRLPLFAFLFLMVALSAFGQPYYGVGSSGGDGSVTVGAPINGSCPTGEVVYSNAGVVGCMPSGGTGCTTAQDNTCAVINITDPMFGAKCDGATNDTAAIQAAAYYATSVRLPVYVPPSAGGCVADPPIYIDLTGNLVGGLETYNAGNQYANEQVVSSASILYISLQDNNIGHTPASSPTWWRPFNWDSGTTYAVGDIVSFDGGNGYSIPWKSLKNSNTNHSPVRNSAYWTPWATNATRYGFSPCIVGTRADSGWNSWISWTYNGSIQLVLGPGQNPCVKNMSFFNGSGPYYRGQTPYGKGIAIAGGSGGAQNTLIENTTVYGAGHACIETGVFRDALAADNHFNNITVQQCSIGVQIPFTQNDINTFDHPLLGYSTTAIKAVPGKDVLINGGNLSAVQAQAGLFTASFGSVTASTCPESGNNNIRCYFVAATITSPDQYWGVNEAGGMQGILPIYNSFMVVTPDFGVVPFVMDSFDSSTGIAQLHTYYNWGKSHYYTSTTVLADTQLGAEITAATSIYAAERVTVFDVAGMQANKVFIEQGNFPCATLVKKESIFNSDNRVSINNMLWNTDPGLTPLGPVQAPGNAAANAAYYCQHSFPWVEISESSGGGTLELNHLQVPSNPPIDPIYIDLIGSGQFIANDVTFGQPGPNIRASVAVAQNEPPFGSALATGLTNTGLITNNYPWQVSAGALAITQNGSYDTSGLMSVPFKGMYPAPYVTPRMLPSLFTTLSGALPAIGSYPLVYPGTTYMTLDPFDSSLAGGKLWAIAAGQVGASYGQNLISGAVGNGSVGGAMVWAYLGQSFVVKMDAFTLQWMVPGLGIDLNNGSGTTHYIVIGVQPQLGYVEVALAANNNSNPTNGLTGTKTVTYVCPAGGGTACAGGTKIGQTAYTFTQF